MTVTERIKVKGKIRYLMDILSLRFLHFLLKQPIVQDVCTHFYSKSTLILVEHNKILAKIDKDQLI